MMAMRREGGTMTTSWEMACATWPLRFSLVLPPYTSRTSKYVLPARCSRRMYLGWWW